ncbi:sperm acrosome membrane-associated protein 6 isoform X4 [Nannospalax galili]|uniref:sperm acrosome membrane-associated protein 6 isoform X4 n=1 Tax=Nannospalax galili TaxID=1026970 RepID=UPI00111C11C2|nr:sperm acrosome membrane-associated protein 6 isoform X4 [Nannospalax galili]
MALVGLAVGTALLAVLVFRASVWACLLCFTGYSERLRLCHMFVDTEGPQVGRCEEALTAAFGGLSDVEINYEERGHLHDAFAQMILSLQEVAAAQGSYKAVFPEAAEKMKKTILKLKEAQACVPPCGVQEGTRRFRCRGCYSSICDLPLDCPAPDSGHGLLPRRAGVPWAPGTDPAGAAHASRDLLLRDPAGPAPSGSAVFLPECDRPSPAGGDGAAGHVPGSDELGTAGGGSGGAREAQPRGAAGPAAGADAGQPVLARGHRGARVRECHAAGVVSPSVCIGCPPQPGI